MLCCSIASSVEVRTQMAASCLNLCHLKDTVSTQLTALMEKVGRRQEEMKEMRVEFKWIFQLVLK
jgi:hypothetical protein